MGRERGREKDQGRGRQQLGHYSMIWSRVAACRVIAKYFCDIFSFTHFLQKDQIQCFAVRLSEASRQCLACGLIQFTTNWYIPNHVFCIYRKALQKGM